MNKATTGRVLGPGGGVTVSRTPGEDALLARAGDQGGGQLAGVLAGPALGGAVSLGGDHGDRHWSSVTTDQTSEIILFHNII